MLRLLICLALGVGTTIGCAPDPKSGKGFSLPVGDVARGQQTFAQLQCHACHTVSGVTFEKLETNTDQKLVVLGGAKTKVQTYGDLVTSIINPSHRFAQGYSSEEVAQGDQSKMRNYNSELTIQQLVDLVTFLETHYSVIKYEPTEYGLYYY